MAKKEYDPFAIRHQPQHHFALDEYTFGLLDKAIAQHKAANRTEAMGKGLCLLLGERFYTPDERKFQKRMEIQTMLSDDVRKHIDAINKIEG
jgi:hypothetical protein